MAKKTAPTANDMVKKSTLWSVAALCLAAGFFGGVVFSIYKAGSPAPIGEPPVQADTGNRGREIEALKRETAQNPNNASGWVDLGNLYFDAGQFEEAIWAYRKSLDLSPNNPNVWTDMGVMYRRSGKPKEAVEAFDEAIRIDPKHEVSRFNKGIVLMHDLNDPEAAIQSWEALLAINPLAMAPNGKSVDEMVSVYKKNMKKPQ